MFAIPHKLGASRSFCDIETEHDFLHSSRRMCGQRQNTKASGKDARFKNVQTHLTEQVRYWARVRRLVHPDRLVPVDDVAGQAEVVEVEDVRVPLLRPHEQPLGLDGGGHGGESLPVEPQLLQQLHCILLDLVRKR